MTMEVLLQTNAGEKVITKHFASLADGEEWVTAMSHNPRFIGGGCAEFYLGVIQ